MELNKTKSANAQTDRRTDRRITVMRCGLFPWKVGENSRNLVGRFLGTRDSPTYVFKFLPYLLPSRFFETNRRLSAPNLTKKVENNGCNTSAVSQHPVLIAPAPHLLLSLSLAHALSCIDYSDHDKQAVVGFGFLLTSDRFTESVHHFHRKP